MAAAAAVNNVVLVEAFMYLHHPQTIRAQEIIRGHAQAAADEGDQETADYLTAVAESPLVFPTDEMLSRVYNYKVLDEEEERLWNELFQEVTQG